MKKTRSTVTNTASATKKLNLCKERVRTLTPTDLNLVVGGSCQTENCEQCGMSKQNCTP